MVDYNLSGEMCLGRECKDDRSFSPCLDLIIFILTNQAPLPLLPLAVGPGLNLAKTGGHHEYVINPFLQ